MRFLTLMVVGFFFPECARRFKVCLKCDMGIQAKVPIGKQQSVCSQGGAKFWGSLRCFSEQCKSNLSASDWFLRGFFLYRRFSTCGTSCHPHFTHNGGGRRCSFDGERFERTQHVQHLFWTRSKCRLPVWPQFL